VTELAQARQPVLAPKPVVAGFFVQTEAVVQGNKRHLALLAVPATWLDK
jgi:hypothetical protein